MKIKGVDGMTTERLKFEVQHGGRFVIFEYCISVLVMTFKRPSDIYFVRQGESAFGRGIGFSLLSLVLGWWGIPWGPIWTVGALISNSRGGRDVTQEVLQSLSLQAT